MWRDAHFWKIANAFTDLNLDSRLSWLAALHRCTFLRKRWQRGRLKWECRALWHTASHLKPSWSVSSSHFPCCAISSLGVDSRFMLAMILVSSVRALGGCCAILGSTQLSCALKSAPQAEQPSTGFTPWSREAWEQRPWVLWSLRRREPESWAAGLQQDAWSNSPFLPSNDRKGHFPSGTARNEFYLNSSPLVC